MRGGLNVLDDLVLAFDVGIFKFRDGTWDRMLDVAQTSGRDCVSHSSECLLERNYSKAQFLSNGRIRSICAFWLTWMVLSSSRFI